MVSTQSSSVTDLPMVPVLISGAGPIGLLLALELTKLNVPVRIIDRSNIISPLSKSLGIQPRTLELFSMIDRQLLDSFVNSGKKAEGFNFWKGGNLAGTLPIIAGQETPFRYVLLQEQNKTSELIMKQLNALGIFVEYNWELIDTKVVEANGESFVETTIRKAKESPRENYNDIDSDSDTLNDDLKVVAQITQYVQEDDQEYEIQVVRSQYLIGSDGGRSTIRHKLNIPFNGSTLPHKTIMFDGTIETDAPLLGKCSIVAGTNKQPMECFPLSNGDLRMVVEGGNYEPGENLTQTVKDITPEKLEEMVRNIIAPTPFKLIRASWISCFLVNERRAETFVHKNKIFLAGDAAHVHSPSGGLGLNTGMQDAHNLAWKLALVHHGLAQESLLETYREREPIADLSIKLSGEILRSNRSLDFFSKHIRFTMIKILPYFFAFLKLFSIPPRETNMLKYTYSQNSLNTPHATQKVPSVEAAVGARAANASLRMVSSSNNQQKGTEEPLQLFDLLVGIGRFNIVVFTGKTLASSSNGKDTPTPASQLHTIIQTRLPAWRSRWNYKFVSKDRPMPEHLIRVHIVAAAIAPIHQDKGVDALAAQANGDGKLYLDEGLLGHSRYELRATNGATAGGIVVIRPDAHVGYRVQGTGKSAWEDVEKYLESILVTN